MPTFTAEQLRASANGTWLHGHVPAGTVSGFTQDSRQLRPGMCFVALTTAQRDGHAFLSAAQASGAAMALVSRADEGCPLPQLVVADVLLAFQRIARAHRLSFTGKVVGVTGSCGKTSTKNILHTLLGEGCHATAGNLNNFIGVPLTLLGLETGGGQVEAAGGSIAPAESSAPEQVVTREQATVSLAGCDRFATGASTFARRLPQFAVIEAGISEPGEMAVLADMIRPDIALITMVGPAHLQDLGSVAGVAAEKAVLAHATGVAAREAPATGDVSDGAVYCVGDVVHAVGGSTSAALSHAVSGSTTTTLPLLFAPLECFAYPAFASLKNEGVAVAPKESAERGKPFEWNLPEGGHGDKNDARQREIVQTAKAENALEQHEHAALLAALPAGIALHRYALECLGETQGGAEAYLSVEGVRLCGRFALGFVPSSGMASNLALALIAAHTLGVPVALLQERVRGWQPQGNRGSWKTFGAQRFFVDCYNANPSSMQDSLAHFGAALAVEGGRAPEQPRLYVIGGMRELGAESARWHNQLGLFLGLASVKAERGDVVVSIGGAADNAALEEGVRVYAPEATVHCFTQTQEARDLVAAFHGIIFLKGSRFYALEALLPPEPAG